MKHGSCSNSSAGLLNIIQSKRVKQDRHHQSELFFFFFSPLWHARKAFLKTSAFSLLPNAQALLLRLFDKTKSQWNTQMERQDDRSQRHGV